MILFNCYKIEEAAAAAEGITKNNNHAIKIKQKQPLKYGTEFLKQENNQNI